MRLSKLKLAGFKSFVDPTTIHFPSNLTGVVGPNGCGKSNVIDAVRWVMGEISAKYLRGTEMADVIFNGSGGRKPVGTASVELVFDNADGVLGGPYAAYAEVSLKRVVSRDGTSTYYINNAKCRRKDITQLFLGTGLGSRSYAIIEQGMISRLIEARPDDLRAFLEEAAGISKYKERRRDTENRISHTRENLDRLNDLREELDKQIRHLQRQAATARRYQAFKEEERKLRAELLALRLRDLDEESRTRESTAALRETELQAGIAALRAEEAGIEHARAEHADRGEALNEVQGRYYQQAADIGRLEQTLAHARELRARQKSDFEQVEAAILEAGTLRARDQSQIDGQEGELALLEPALTARRAEEASADAALASAEAAMHAWQESFTSFSTDTSAAEQATMVERARIEQLEGRCQRSADQLERLTQERGALEAQDARGTLAALAERERSALATAESSTTRLDTALTRLLQLRGEERRLSGELDAARENAQTTAGQRLSVEALQQAALGTVQGQVVAWLKDHKLGQHPRLAQQLSVEKGWERSVETVLGSYLEAVCVPGLDAVAALLGDLKVGQLTFLGLDAEAPRTRGPSLLDKVKGPTALGSLLGSIRAVERLDEALARRAKLEPGESIITRDGIWIGREWLRVSRDRDVHAGVIEREGDLKRLAAAQHAADAAVAALQQGLERTREELRNAEQAREDAQAQVNQSHRAHVDAQGQHEAQQTRAAAGVERLQQLLRQAEELAAESASASDEMRAAQRRREAALASLASLEARRPALESERDARRATLARERELAQVKRAAAQDIAIKAESRRAALASLRTSLERVAAQLAALAARRDELAGQIEAGGAPLAARQRELESLLAGRVELERELASARAALERAEAEFRSRDERRVGAERAVEAARQAVSVAALAAQETRVRRESLLEQFAATKFELTEVNAGLLAEHSVPTWEQNLADVVEKIERLGQVNLAAIDEFREVSERKEYLDRQFNDLMEALNTLEQAIRKIDKETRTRFQDTFDRVNAGLKEKFPRLFGGGHAYLELTSDDVLSAGVGVMARPPGKRNVTISQLSGGEKALTAVALVFSIFDLNPAPFCLLDEVDAPLDDHNVGRFCDIVREMSERVQFLFITHNKNTMELAEQLIGVTMNEPGVSRLVAVDVDAALRLAAG
jgi:chromosome segregation protein